MQKFYIARLSLCLLAFTSILSSAIAAEEQSPSNGRHHSTYQIVHGWPTLADDYILGQVPGVAADSHQHVFVFQRADHALGTGRVSKNDELIAAATVLCFEADSGKLIASWGDHFFLMPHGLRADPANHIWVTDVGRHQVFEFDHDGKLLLTLGTEKMPGCDGRHFNKPTDIAFASDHSVFISDGYGNNRVAKFSSTGEFLFDWGRPGSKPGEFNLPHGIAIDSQDRVYVADRSNGRIQVFNPDGTFLREWKSAELGRPWAITIGPEQCAYVVDGGDLKPRPPDRAHLLKLDLDGHILAKWARYGNYDGQLFWPHAVAVDQHGSVYVGDILGMRVQKFSR